MNTNNASEFKSVSGLKQGNVVFVDAGKLEKAGTTGVVAEGIYEGSGEIETKYGPRTQYKLRANNGDLILITAAGNLNYRMSQAENQGMAIGTPVQVSYLGKLEMKSGPRKGTPAHTFDVAIAVDSVA